MHAAGQSLRYFFSSFGARHPRNLRCHFGTSSWQTLRASIAATAGQAEKLVRKLRLFDDPGRERSEQKPVT